MPSFTENPTQIIVQIDSILLAGCRCSEHPRVTAAGNGRLISKLDVG